MAVIRQSRNGADTRAMSHGAESEWWVVGSYELVGVSGSLLPARALAISGNDRRVEQCRILAGTMRLAPDNSYEMAVTAEYDGTADVIYTQSFTNRGTWRFVSSALPGPSGAIVLCSQQGDSVSAALTGVSLIHHAPIQMRAVQWTLTNWVYLRTGSAG
jgi:hypothetical protein